MSAQQSSILIVDDDAHLRETLQDLLELEGYNVTQAASGQEAMSLVASQFFDVILMDFNLTDKTGIEVIRDIRKFNQESQIVMITAHASLDTAVRAIQESVYDFLIKPVDLTHFKRVIKKALEKLRLEQDIKNLVAELKKKNEELQSMNDMKSKFLSMASHDLSNTLMTLQLSFDLLCASIKPDQDQSKKIDYITNGIAQIARLIGDLVDWASIEQGKLRMETNYFEVDKWLEEVLGGARARSMQKGIDVAGAVNCGKTMICADKRRITQVIMNLVENAVRHTPRGGKITIGADMAEDGGVCLSVTDTGEGLDSSELPKLFRSFYQAETGKARGRLGLGLSIAKEIVVSHGGRLWVESAGPGQGASFLFVLPAAQQKGTEVC